MIRTPITFATCLVAAALFAATASYAGDSPGEIKQRMGSGDPAKGKTRSELCQGCHGEFGLSFEDMIPNLAGQYAGYLSKQLHNFQAGTRKHQIMSAIAQTVNDAEITDITAYFSSQNKMQGDGKGDNPVGKNLFLKGDAKRGITACTSCHGKNGKGQSPGNATFPVIGGQHKGYLANQLNHWRSGERSNSPGGVMNKIAKNLTDAEINALTDYMSGL